MSDIVTAHRPGSVCAPIREGVGGLLALIQEGLQEILISFADFLDGLDDRTKFGVRSYNLKGCKDLCIVGSGRRPPS